MLKNLSIILKCGVAGSDFGPLTALRLSSHAFPPAATHQCARSPPTLPAAGSARHALPRTGPEPGLLSPRTGCCTGAEAYASIADHPPMLDFATGQGGIIAIFKHASEHGSYRTCD